MPGTPSPLKLGFERNSYSRVSFGNSQCQQTGAEEEQITQLLEDKARAASEGAREKDAGAGLKTDTEYINPGEDDQMEVYGYCRSVVRASVTWVLIVLSAGLLRLVFHWAPHWLLLATHEPCSLARADKVLLVEQYQERHKCRHVKAVATLTADSKTPGDAGGEWSEEEPLDDVITTQPDRLAVHLAGGKFKEYSSLRLFRCKKLIYVWDEERQQFLRLLGLDKDVSAVTLHQMRGLTERQQYLRRLVYGSNEINVPLRSVMTLLFLEVLNPFYVFQVFSFCLWFADDYVYYAAAILIMSSFGIVMSIVQTRRNQKKLHSTVHSTDVAMVMRGGGAVGSQPDAVPTEQLVPGDVLVVPPHGCIMHCDAVLLIGNCIVNESMLTGESVPVTKTPLPCTAEPYSNKEHGKHTLFCGTHVIQTRYYGQQHVLAVVVRTGFSTAKGALVRSILYPPPVDFKFDHDSYKFVEMLAGIASVGFLYTVVTKHMRGLSAAEIALDALDLITIVVPPALPAAMTVGRFYAQQRLQAKDIYCISPRTINVSGSIDCVCFDKTGTLTEDGLDMWGVVPISEQKFLLPVKDASALPVDELIISLATCHSLTIIDNKLSGDPLDLKMFECTHWVLEEPQVNDNSKFDVIFPSVVKPPKRGSVLDLDMPGLEVGIVRQFPFSSSLQRMSVITRTLGGSHFQVFCKGAPEAIVALSTPQSVPADFGPTLEEYTQEGYRVLAVACKTLRRMSVAKVDRLAREEAESRLTLLGLIVMENRLKPETCPIIDVLNQASIRTIMVTGDNMLTALSVARDCAMVPLKEKVFILQAQPPVADRPAQLCFTHSSCNSQHDVMSIGGGGDNNSSDLNNSSSVTSLDPLASPPATPEQEGAEGTGPPPGRDGYSLALTGHSWAAVRAHFPDVLARVVARGAVFARMSPDQKQQLVQELQALGYYVAMCGDGANDCGALKAAHCGISLSEAESSVASPFTSRRADISCVPQIIREGRAALVTSFGIFKYMAAYSLTQFVSVMILYSIDTNLSDKEFLYIDLFLITVFAFFFGRTEAYAGPLVKSPPILSLISLAPILSLALQMVLVIGVQCAAFYSVQSADWFVPYNASASTVVRDKGEASYENYAIFSVSSLQYIVLALVFSKGAPYRKSVLHNHGFLLSLITLTAFTVYVITGPFPWLQRQFSLQMPPTITFRLVVLALGLGNLVLACFIEYFLVDYLVLKKMRYRWQSASERRRYREVNLELRRDSSWPPLSSRQLPDVAASWDRPPRSPVEISEMEPQTFVPPRGGSLPAPRTRVQSVVEPPTTAPPAAGEEPARRRYYSSSEATTRDRADFSWPGEHRGGDC